MSKSVPSLTSPTREEIELSPIASQAFQATQGWLSQSATFLAPFPSVVDLRDVVSAPPLQDDSTSLLTPNRGHHALFRALEKLEGLEKEEVHLKEHCTLTLALTEIALQESFPSSRHALEALQRLAENVPRRVCQHPFKRNDIVWVCRTCQADETCVLCHACFSHSHHEGHDVAFYHAQAGGCCDCGDPDAWDPRGFCPRHGPRESGGLQLDILERTRGIVVAAADWMVETIAHNAEQAHLRTRNTSYTNSTSTTTSLDHFFTSNNTHNAPAPHAHHDDDSSDGVRTDQALLLQHAHVFSPSVASSARHQRPNTTPNPVARQLGTLARTHRGLYLVVHADDVHSTATWMSALRALFGSSSYYTDSLLGKLVRALRQYGQLVVWGSMEILAECSAAQIKLWLDGDAETETKIGSIVLERALQLTNNGLHCSIVTRQELQYEQRAVALSQWLTAVAHSCDPLCQTVAESILPQRHLVPLLRADFWLSARITKAWHSLLLMLLAVPTFKSHLAAAYCDTYRKVTYEYARGMGVLERSGYTLSVQFLNRVAYVVDLVQGRDLLGKLGKALLETMTVASAATMMDHQNVRLNPHHFVLTHRRYSPCISDLKCVLNVKGMARLFAHRHSTFMQDWLAALSLSQFMDTQVWRTWSQNHVEVEARGWVGAFNASISLSSLFERLLSWNDDDPSPIADPKSPLSTNLLTCVELTVWILHNALLKWQQVEMDSYHPTLYNTLEAPYKRCPASLPFSTVAAKHGTALAMWALPVSQVTAFSFHLPLHRFVAACLREVCLRNHDHPTNGMMALLHQLSDESSNHQLLFRGLMEFPVLVLSRAAQVRAGLWRRNGPGLNDQVLNYAEPPFCRVMRDSDLLLVQFALLGRRLPASPETVHHEGTDVGVAVLVHLWLHRLGLFDFMGFTKAPNVNLEEYKRQVSLGLYPGELRPDDARPDFLQVPWTYSPSRDASASLLLLEEFLHFVIILISELPPVSPRDKSDHIQQAKERLRREVVHRLASGPKTHSELSEVHHVLSHWDNVYLSEEGKAVNPDDATGAALGAALAEVGDRKSSRASLEPDKWELQRSAWGSYDPSFFHISLRSHQTAAENRPTPTAGSPFGFEPTPFCPVPQQAHPSFVRLRRDMTADATLLATLYRTLHLHCHEKNSTKSMVDLPGKIMYESDERSETALARVVHLLTLGAIVWQDADPNDPQWRQHGGGSVGSVFSNRTEAPSAADWIQAALLADPSELMACDWYKGEEKSITLLRRLAVDGGFLGGFVAQDKVVRAGAAWLCDFAMKHSSAASSILRPQVTVDKESAATPSGESEFERRKRLAKERTMERMKAQAAKVADMLKLDFGEDSDAEDTPASSDPSASVDRPDAPMRSSSFNSALSSASSFGLGSDSERVGTPSGHDSGEDSGIPARLLKARPQCIICSDDGNAEHRVFSKDDQEHEGHKSRRRKTDGSNALAFVGYAQASTVLKGGGGPPSSSDSDSPLCSVRRFVGAHVALCGHAVHSECCESYLATVSHREDRVIGKRDEFRCPLCQRLSNCLVPFIDVGLDWIDTPTCLPDRGTEVASAKSDGDSSSSNMQVDKTRPLSLHDFLTTTPWWVTRHDKSVVWDGQCAFVGIAPHPSPEETCPQTKPSRRRSVRSLRKKDLYAAWNAMMRTPRFVRKKLRHHRGSSAQDESVASADSMSNPTSSETAGETVVWRRFMDQVCDIAFRSDGKRLGEENLHNDFGEFRHYHVERHAYNYASRMIGEETSDWPSCVFTTVLSETQRQAVSREKLLSKLLMTIQSFTYSCCSESMEARRLIRKLNGYSENVAGLARDTGDFKTICSKFGIVGLACDQRLVLMPRPTPFEEDGSQPFSGRLGKLRYFGLAVMATAGAVAADLIQIALPFPNENNDDFGLSSSDMDVDKPERAPIAYPILFGHVLTHVVAAICASCGRARARSDSLELAWPPPFSSGGSFVAQKGSNGGKDVESVIEDCEGFIKLGLLARVLQVLLAKMGVPPTGGKEVVGRLISTLKCVRTSGKCDPSKLEGSWVLSCVDLTELAVLNSPDFDSDSSTFSVPPEEPTVERFMEACSVAAAAACSYLSDVGIVLQVLVPGAMARYDSSGSVQRDAEDQEASTCLRTFEKLRRHFRLEDFSEMLQSSLLRTVVSNWFNSACRHAQAAVPQGAAGPSGSSVKSKLFRTQGFRSFDWPVEFCHDIPRIGSGGSDKEHHKSTPSIAEDEPQPQDELATPMQIDAIQSPGAQSSPAELLKREQGSPPLVAFASKKTVPLIGGYPLETSIKGSGRPRVAVIPASYTDLYAELGNLLPECEQTAVCLVCGEVLNAGGKGECTRHSYKCGAGTGMFFLLQECAGLIMHNGKAAYIHSPYVDSHGETPQYRGRPLNLDLDRFNHLHEIWSGHSVRQQVLAERGSSRQVIISDFY